MPELWIADSVRQYRNVLVIRSSVKERTVLGDDAYIQDSEIGADCIIERRSMVFSSELGDHSYTGYQTVVRYAHIGKYTSISWNVSLGGENHRYRSATTHPFPYNPRYGLCPSDDADLNIPSETLRIGSDVWIAGNVSILRGAHIGHGAVIGAGSVVTKEIPPYAVAYGVPAEVHGFRFEAPVVERLLAWQWWDWPEEVLRDSRALFRGDLTEEKLRGLEDLYRSLRERGAISG